MHFYPLSFCCYFHLSVFSGNSEDEEIEQGGAYDAEEAV